MIIIRAIKVINLIIMITAKDVNHKLPLKKDGSDMYEAMDDGILLCKVGWLLITTYY